MFPPSTFCLYQVRLLDYVLGFCLRYFWRGCRDRMLVWSVWRGCRDRWLVWSLWRGCRDRWLVWSVKLANILGNFCYPFHVLPLPFIFFLTSAIIPLTFQSSVTSRCTMFNLSEQDSFSSRAPSLSGARHPANTMKPLASRRLASLFPNPLSQPENVKALISLFILKTHWWLLAVVCSFVGLLSL